MNKEVAKSVIAQFPKYSDMAKRDSFFGKVLQRSNKYFIPDQIKDEDNAIIKTNNIPDISTTCSISSPLCDFKFSLILFFIFSFLSI